MNLIYKNKNQHYPEHIMKKLTTDQDIHSNNTRTRDFFLCINRKYWGSKKESVPEGFSWLQVFIYKKNFKTKCRNYVKNHENILYIQIHYFQIK